MARSRIHFAGLRFFSILMAVPQGRPQDLGRPSHEKARIGSRTDFLAVVRIELEKKRPPAGAGGGGREKGPLSESEAKGEDPSGTRSSAWFTRFVPAIGLEDTRVGSQLKTQKQDALE